MDPGLAFGKVLREVRKSAHLTQEQLAFAAGIDRIYVSLLERGERQPTVRVVFKLAVALNTRPSDLIARTENIVSSE